MDLDAIRADLEQAVRESDAAIAAMEAEDAEDDGELTNLDQNSADQASNTTESDREEALVEAAEVRRDEAKAALARLADGTFGTCVDCGEKIAEARLEYRPEASRCLACQEKLEAAEA